MTVTELLGRGPHAEPARRGLPGLLPPDRNPYEVFVEFTSAPSTVLALALADGRIEPAEIVTAIANGDIDMTTAAWTFEKAVAMGYAEDEAA